MEKRLATTKATTYDILNTVRENVPMDFSPVIMEWFKGVVANVIIESQKGDNK